MRLCLRLESGTIWYFYLTELDIRPLLLHGRPSTKRSIRSPSSLDLSQRQVLQILQLNIRDLWGVILIPSGSFLVTLNHLLLTEPREPRVQPSLTTSANMASVGRNAAKVLGINLDYRKEPEVSGAASISSVETCEYCRTYRSATANDIQTSNVNPPR
ncbi:Sulfate permease 2 [Alternaria alternata]|nr:Sulfate permease 2 [Alternaria alternata]